ncbi:N-acetyltransferase [Clostridium thermobutyricum]|uniref:Putative N-acetyltransferase YjaB n=1 Tax=Clostridium thermobutyricum DSM 4928 TaxID=1121339 RepID=A0A1V4SL84_9CLOT|nr:N-acetyltransferase [Clostridium thermobutyricum]OPX44649.1 putative N-acetyltransferase YjaB [Clostridium thermobutyricum DSM 4928]
MIRKLRNEDIEKVMKIWKDITIKAHDFISKEYWENNYDVVKNTYIPMSETFIYEIENKIKGFISVINNEFIGALFVDINCQGLGVGSELINYVVKEYNKLSLAVYKENKNAVEFYISKGFKIIKEQIDEETGAIEYIMSI